MLSLDLRQILLPKNASFRSSENANFVKNFATNPAFCQILSKVDIFVTIASFRHFVSFSSKTKFLEPIYYL